jgi:hypothetical protein
LLGARLRIVATFANDAPYLRPEQRRAADFR